MIRLGFFAFISMDGFERLLDSRSNKYGCIQV